MKTISKHLLSLPIYHSILFFAVRQHASCVFRTSYHCTTMPRLKQFTFCVDWLPANSIQWRPQSSRRQCLKATDEAQARCQYCRSAFTGCLASGGRHDKILLVLTHLVRHAYLGAKGELNFVKWFELVIMYVTYNLASRLLLLGYLFPLYFPCISPYFSAQTKLSGIVTW